MIKSDYPIPETWSGFWKRLLAYLSEHIVCDQPFLSIQVDPQREAGLIRDIMNPEKHSILVTYMARLVDMFSYVGLNG